MIDNEMKNSLLSPEDGHNLNRVVKLFNARRLGAESMKHFVRGRLKWPKNLANGALSLNNESSLRDDNEMKFRRNIWQPLKTSWRNCALFQCRHLKIKLLAAK